LPEGAWNAGQALFFNHFMSYLDISTDADFDMGVIPVPKHDGTQTEYLTTSTFGAALWSVIRSAAGYEDLCTVLDTLASESYRTVTPRYFDTILAGRRDTKEDYDMLYKIREGIVIDGGRVITEPFDEMTFGIWRSAMRGDKNYLTLYNEQNFAEEVIAFNMLMKDMETIFG
jgi:hypothetical protein